MLNLEGEKYEVGGVWEIMMRGVSERLEIRYTKCGTMCR